MSSKLSFKLSSKLENGMISWERVSHIEDEETSSEVALYKPMLPLPWLLKPFRRLLLKLHGDDIGQLFMILGEIQDSNQVCGLIWLIGEDEKFGHRLAASNDIHELMERASRHYPGYMLGVSKANSCLVAIRGAIDPKMWGFWLAALALAIQAINCAN